MEEEKKLTDKKKRFCEEYLIDLNATQAAIRAGYSKNTAAEIGCENLIKPNIQKYIEERKADRAKRTELSQDEVLKELKNFAFSDITETILLSSEQIKELPENVRRLIVSYKKVSKRFGEDQEFEEESVELKFVDKMKAFEMLNKHIGFYEADNEQGKTVINTVPEINILGDTPKLKDSEKDIEE